MIFVCLGTQDKAFDRLPQMVETCIKDEIITEPVKVQAGFTKYASDAMEVFDYIGMEDYKSLMENCNILITHGGVGTIVQGVKLEKVVIAVPRLAQYGEHVNDHQKEIIESFTEQEYILSANTVEELKIALEKAKSFKPRPFVSNTDNFIKLLKRELDL